MVDRKMPISRWGNWMSGLRNEQLRIPALQIDSGNPASISFFLLALFLLCSPRNCSFLSRSQKESPGAGEDGRKSNSEGSWNLNPGPKMLKGRSRKPKRAGGGKRNNWKKKKGRCSECAGQRTANKGTGAALTRSKVLRRQADQLTGDREGAGMKAH
ncbi:hypothetical protein BJX99DRAFT_150268 [Aspergillus californicus]